MPPRARSSSNLIWHDEWVGGALKIVLVGQAPSRDTDGQAPFTGRSGKRLEQICGLKPGQLPERFALANVLQRWPGSAGKGDLFPLGAARTAAAALAVALDGRRVVAIGRTVAWLLGLPRSEPNVRWRVHEPFSAIAVLPHPSGVNVWWNSLANREAAETFMRSICAR